MCALCEARRNNRLGELIHLTTVDCSGCNLLTSIPDTLVNLTELFCYNCPLLATIPDTLVNLTRLYCFNCPLLVSIPDTLINLTRLNCSHCPLLASITGTLVNLTGLVCSYCPLLTSIPDTLVKLLYLHCYDCYWLPRNDPVPPSRSARVTVIQRWARRSRKGRLLSRWMKTRGFNEWFYAPSGIGGKRHIRRLVQFVEEL